MSENASPKLAVVIAAHGERGGRADNMVLSLLRDGVAAALPEASIHAGVLNGEPTLEAALAEAAASGSERLIVYPFFMSDGYFVRTVIPSRIARAGSSRAWRVLPPLGLDAGLPALVHDQALIASTNAGWAPQTTRVLLIGHGSTKSDASARATRSVTAAVGQIGGFDAVECAFLEEPPLLADALAAPHPRTIVIGLMSGEGLHGADDIPAAIGAGNGGARYGGTIGAAPAVAGLVVRALQLELGTPEVAVKSPSA